MMSDVDRDGNDDSDASFSSEDSQEPYFHVETGKVLPAREAWSILAAEGHPRHPKREKSDRRGSGSGVGAPTETESTTAIVGPPFETPPPPRPVVSEEDSNSTTSPVQQGFSAGPTQSSIDRALHTGSPNYISPAKEFKKSASYGSGHGPIDLPPSESQDEDEDPVILRAKAMALAAQNGQKLTPAQMQLIARPDVQQQKLIEEAKRVQKAKDAAEAKEKSREMQDQLLKQLSAPVDNLRGVGADFKKFVLTEKGKGATTPLQWGADLGKFIETQASTRFGHGGGENSGGGDGPGDNDDEEEKEDAHGDDAEQKNATASSSSLPAVSSPRSKRKMEGFGTDPSAPSSPPAKGGSLWPSMAPLPLLNESIANMLPSVGGGGASDDGATEDVRFSGVLWKRRSGFGKHSTIKAWERRRVELRGSKLIYYRTQEEKEEEDLSSKRGGGGPALEAPPFPSAAADGGSDNANEGDGSVAAAAPKPSGEAADGDSGGLRPSGGEVPPVNGNSSAPIDPAASLLSAKRYSSIFGQAAQAAEQRLVTAQSSLALLAASATGLESLRPSSADTPRGSLDLLKEHASVSVSMGHSGAPTPFCLSIKVKGETKWKFCFDGHGVLMEWLAGLTDVLVQASLDAKNEDSERSERSGGFWEMEDYCIGQGTKEEEYCDGKSALDTSLPSIEKDVDVTTTAIPGVGAQQWMIMGKNLQVAWALTNMALIIARSSSTSIDRYWMLVVFANLGFWQLCTRSGTSPSRLRSNKKGENITTQLGSGRKTKSALVESKSVTTARKGSFKPIAGNTTVQVTKVEDSNINKNGDQLPSWVPISSSIMDVRSHGYLATKKKIPSPGELYECVAVDCFESNNRFPEIAPRVRLPEMKFHDTDCQANGNNKPWKSPDIFIVSISLPTEAPRFGQSTDDGPGLTFVGYFKMKEETRRILRRISKDDKDPAGHDLSSDELETENDVQKSIVNGVRLWERYCREAPSDPSFQARFKLIPSANLAELGCPSYIAKYNGKPVLIKRNRVTGFFDDHRDSTGLDVMEFDISLHPFPYLFKQAMAYLKDYFDKTTASFGFVIEGRNDEELPEVVIGAMCLCYPSPEYIVNGENFFDGTCPKSTGTQSEISCDHDNNK